MRGTPLERGTADLAGKSLTVLADAGDGGVWVNICAAGDTVWLMAGSEAALQAVLEQLP